MAIKNISRALNLQGIAVLRFDFTGLGESEGDFADTNFSSNIEDLVCAAEYLGEHFQAPELLIGHSLGGAAVIAAATELPAVKAVVTIGAPADPAHVSHLVASGMEALENEGVAEVNIGGRPFTIKKQFIEDIKSRNLTDKLDHFNGRALLIMHSPQDWTVEIANAAKLYTAARHPKSFVTLDGADHLLTNPADAEYAANLIATWANRAFRGR
jgi:putative redox protein